MRILAYVYFQKINKIDSTVGSKNQFVWISEREPYLRRRKEEINSAKKSKIYHNMGKIPFYFE
jgi:hypothetical protein